MKQSPEFKVLRPFFMGEDPVKRGEVVCITDRHLLTGLLNAGKIEPTTETAAMLRRKPCLEFNNMSDSERMQWQPPQPGNMLRPSRN